ncbi:MAG: hypothetical protein ABID61_04720 [Candidatus Micrarchaeota archaeon]
MAELCFFCKTPKEFVIRIYGNQGYAPQGEGFICTDCLKSRM